MEARGKEKRTENSPENPEESNALLEFPKLNPYDSFLMIEDEPNTENKKREKSRKRKQEKSQKTSKKELRPRNISKSCSRKESESCTLLEEISPWPAEWQRASKTQDCQYENSDDSKRSTYKFKKGKCEGNKQGNSCPMLGKAARDENIPTCSFWKETEPLMSEKEINFQPVALPQYELASVPHQEECSQNSYCTADNNVGECSAGEDGPPHKEYIGGRVTRSRVGRYDVKDVSSERETSRDTSFKNAQGDVYVQGVATNTTANPLSYVCVAPCSSTSNKSPTAGDVKTTSSHQPVAPTNSDYKSASRVSSEEAQTFGQGQIVASYLSESPLNLNTTTNKRPNVVMHPSQQSEGAQGSISRQHTASLQLSSSPEANQCLNQNYLCDIIIKSVPLSFLSSVQARAQNENQGNPSGSTAVNIDPSVYEVKGSLSITINPASRIQGQKVPTTPRRDTKKCSSSKKKTPQIRPKRFHRHLHHQKPPMDNENFADDEMEDESSDENQEK